MKKMYPYAIVAIIVLLGAGYYLYEHQLPLLFPLAITGRAQNVKQGAEILTEKYGPVLIQGLPSWPNEAVGRQIVAVGRRMQKQTTVPAVAIDEHGGISQGAQGEIRQMVLIGMTKWSAQFDSKEVPDKVKSQALEAVRRGHGAITPRIMDQPAPVLENGTWMLTVVDVSARAESAGAFLVTVDVETGGVRKIDRQ